MKHRPFALIYFRLQLPLHVIAACLFLVHCSASPYPVLGTQHSPGIWYTLTTYIPDTRPITRCTYSTLRTYLTASQTSRSLNIPIRPYPSSSVLDSLYSASSTHFPIYCPLQSLPFSPSHLVFIDQSPDVPPSFQILITFP